jgi:phosphoglycerol transferase MdoB-like AlkP superfamily enzyme
VQPDAFLHWLESTPLALFVSQGIFGFSALDMIHIAAISVVFGMIAVVDLRLLGIASKDCAVTDICRQALPWTWVAFGIAVLTGVLMFMGQAAKYYNNYAFRMKLLLLLLAGINMLVFHYITYRGVAKWDRAAIPLSARLAGAISLACWIAVVAYGRWTAYYMF